MTDTKFLKSLLVAKGITLNQLAELTGISLTSLSYKVNNHRQFTAREISVIQKALNLTNDERDNIFFTTNVE